VLSRQTVRLPLENCVRIGLDHQDRVAVARNEDIERRAIERDRSRTVVFNRVGSDSAWGVRIIAPFTLTVAPGTDSVPSPLKSMSSTIAFGCATPATMLNPDAEKTYEPCSVVNEQTSSRSSACASPHALSTIAAHTKTRHVTVVMFFSLCIRWTNTRG
jgi:hypothetical protein